MLRRSGSWKNVFDKIRKKPSCKFIPWQMVFIPCHVKFLIILGILIKVVSESHSRRFSNSVMITKKSTPFFKKCDPLCPANSCSRTSCRVHFQVSPPCLDKRAVVPFWCNCQLRRRRTRLLRSGHMKHKIVTWQLKGWLYEIVLLAHAVRFWGLCPDIN